MVVVVGVMVVVEVVQTPGDVQYMGMGVVGMVVRRVLLVVEVMVVRMVVRMVLD